MSYPMRNIGNTIVVTSNCGCTTQPNIYQHPSMATTLRILFGVRTHEGMNGITITTKQAIADTGAMSIFIMDGVGVNNKHIATNPITINMPDGRKVQSRQVCNIIISGLPNKLIGYVVPHLVVASLIGIHLL